MLKKKSLILPAVWTAACALLTLPADAKIEPDPQYGDVIVLYSDPGSNGENADPLCNVLNACRSEHGAVQLKISDTLTEQAVKRAAQLSDGSGRADARTLDATEASETVIRGCADINTMICSILLSEQQSKNLFYNGYTQLGYASNEDQTVRVLLMTS